VSPNEYIFKQREITKKWDDLELWLLVTALPLIELYHCIKFQVDIFNTFRVMRRKWFVTEGRTDRQTRRWRSDPFMSHLLCRRQHKNVWNVKEDVECVEHIFKLCVTAKHIYFPRWISIFYFKYVQLQYLPNTLTNWTSWHTVSHATFTVEFRFR